MTTTMAISYVKYLCGALVLAAALMLSNSAFAHHGTAAYDNDSFTTLKGIVSDFQFVNPHVQLSWETKNANGNVEKWQGEITSPSQLARAGGWNKNSLKPGDEIAVSGYPAKNGSHTMVIRKVVVRGQELKVSGDSNN